MDAPRNDLYRSTPPMEVRAADDGRMTLFGHFSVFNAPTLISSQYEGTFIERIAPGAFTKTLNERADRIRIMWNHGRPDQAGQLANVIIAKPKQFGQDERGGFYEAELFRGLPEWLYEGLREGQYGASFRFQAIDDHWDRHPRPSEDNPDGLPERTVREAKVFELGPVSWGAYPDATAAVRSLSDRFHDLSTPTNRAALVAPGTDGAAPSNANEADDSASHLGGMTPAQREYALRSVLL